MCDRIDGCPEQMRDFLQLQRVRPDLNTIPTVSPGPTCNGGVMSCADLSTVDRDVTARLVRYLTHMTQGITGYVDIMRKTSQIYADGAASTAADIRAAATYKLSDALPDVAPDLSTPEFKPRDA